MASHHRHHLTAGHHLLLFLLLVTALYASAQSSTNNNNNNNNNQYFPNTNFNPSMAIVIIVLISAFFFLGFFSIYIRQCAGDRLNPRLSSTTTTTAATAARSRRQRGLDPELLQTFPTLVYSEVKGLKIGKESLECAVCLSEFEDDETLRLLPKCSHVFHPDCIDAWLAAHVTCPVCRCNLTESDEKTSKNDALTTETSPEQLVELPTPEQQQQQEEMTRIQIDQDDESRAEMENLERFVNLKRARSQARPVNFPRSHSTGHSLVQPGQNLDRFTLRLPEDIRKEIVAANLQRTTSCSVAFRREASTRRGYTEGSVGRGGRSIRLGRSDRWGSFLSRTLSIKNWGRRGEPEMGSGSVKAVRFNGVMGPLGGNSSVEGKEDEVSSTAALNNV